MKKYIEALKKEDLDSTNFLHCTANESRMSDTAKYFLGSNLADRYYLGAGDQNQVMNSGTFFGRGLPHAENLITKAKQATCKMLGAYSVNLNLLSGVHAMMSSILATTEPGETVMTVEKKDGGHFATKCFIIMILKNFKIILPSN